MMPGYYIKKNSSPAYPFRLFIKAINAYFCATYFKDDCNH